MKNQVVIPAQIQQLLDGLKSNESLYTRKNYHDRLLDIQKVITQALFEYNREVDEGYLKPQQKVKKGPGAAAFGYFEKTI